TVRVSGELKISGYDSGSTWGLVPGTRAESFLVWSEVKIMPPRGSSPRRFSARKQSQLALIVAPNPVVLPLGSVAVADTSVPTATPTPVNLTEKLGTLPMLSVIMVVKPRNLLNGPKVGSAAKISMRNVVFFRVPNSSPLMVRSVPDTLAEVRVG